MAEKLNVMQVDVSTRFVRDVNTTIIDMSLVIEPVMKRTLRAVVDLDYLINSEKVEK